MPNEWKECTVGSPCPICQWDHWCAVSDDGFWCNCRKNPCGNKPGKNDRNGGIYYVHDLRNCPCLNMSKSQQALAAILAPPDRLHAIYSAFLCMLPLSGEHRKNLLDRGLTDDQIELRLYRTYGWNDRQKIADDLYARFGSELFSVAGFYWKDSPKGGQPAMHGWEGMFVPSRNPDCQIVGLRNRVVDASGEKQYHWFSPGKKKPGVKVQQGVHFPIGMPERFELCRLTEGELKADVAFLISGFPTLGLPGVGNWRLAIVPLRRAGCGRILLSVDSDALKNKHVSPQLRNAYEGYMEAGFVVELETWNREHKGIDDLLHAGGRPQILSGHDAVAYIERAIEESGAKVPKQEPEERPSPTDVLIALAISSLDLFHAPDGRNYATTKSSPKRTIPISSRSGDLYLTHLYRQKTSRSINSDAIFGAKLNLEAKAFFDGPEKEVYIRVAPGEKGTIEIDLADPEYRVAVVGPHGWKVADPTAAFLRRRGMNRLPDPKKGCEIDLLRKYVCCTDTNWTLIMSFLLSCFRPAGPYPILVLNGPPGSLKSTTAELIRSLIDPNVANLRAESKEVRDLMISASSSWVLAFDNLNGIPGWLSEALCRMSTGGGFAVRELHSDMEETIFDVERPTILTGVKDLAVKPDLLQRCLLVRLKALDETSYKSREDVLDEFKVDRPFIFGALLDVISSGLRALPTAKTDYKPRMVGTSYWMSACESGLGWAPGRWAATHKAMTTDTNEVVLENSPIVEPIRLLLATCGEWEGTASDLLGELRGLAGPDTVRERLWPKAPQVLTGRLREISTNLLNANIVVDQDARDVSGKRRIIRLHKKNYSSAIPQGKRRDLAPEAPEAPPKPQTLFNQPLAGGAQKTPKNHEAPEAPPTAPEASDEVEI